MDKDFFDRTFVTVLLSRNKEYVENVLNEVKEKLSEIFDKETIKNIKLKLFSPEGMSQFTLRVTGEMTGEQMNKLVELIKKVKESVKDKLFKGQSIGL